MSAYWSHHCPGCRYGIRIPGCPDDRVRTNYDSDETSCCTCCYDSEGNVGPGRNDGGGW